MSKYNHQVGTVYTRRNEHGRNVVTFDIRCVVDIREVDYPPCWRVEVNGKEVKQEKWVFYRVFTVTVYPNKIIVKTDEVQRATMNAWARNSVEINKLEYLIRSGRTVVSTLRDALRRYQKYKSRYKVQFDVKAVEKVINDFEESID